MKNSFNALTPCRGMCGKQAASNGPIKWQCEDCLEGGRILDGYAAFRKTKSITALLQTIPRSVSFTK